MSAMPKNKPTPITSAPRLIPPPEGWPEELSGEAFYGLAGEIVHTITPHTEADPNAILLQLLIGFGNLIGRTAYVVNDGTRHYMNEFCVLAGKSGRSRKGTSWARSFPALEAADSVWANTRIESGLSSGEGLIEPVKDIEGENAGQTERRLLLIEPEFASVLTAASRQGNVLSPMCRSSWDTGILQALTKSPTRASGAHISIIGHITNEELKDKLTKTEQANGFANRFIWICVRRKRKLSRHKYRLDMNALNERFAAAARFASAVREIDLAPETENQWDDYYYSLPDETPGIFGALTDRAEGHVSRLAAIYALLDQSAVIRPKHLQAAIALWEFSERCVRYIFGEKTGTPIGDAILSALRSAPAGLTRSEISRIFHNHQNRDMVAQCMSSLAYSQQIESVQIATNGRPKEVWRLTDFAAQAPADLAPALRAMVPDYTDRDANALWRACRERAADCTAAEVGHAVALKMPTIRSGKVHYPVAFIRSTVPDYFTGGALNEYRQAQQAPAVTATPEDRQAAIDQLYTALHMHQGMLANATDDEARRVQTLNIQSTQERLAEMEMGEGVSVSRRKAKKAKKG